MPDTSVFRLPTRFARRIPDPNFADIHNMERHILFVPANQVPPGLPYDPNARLPNINRRVYKEVERSLLNQEGEPGAFHLKHKGITLVARRVDRIKEDEYRVVFAPGHGILDGGHTYELLTKKRLEEDEQIPDNQYVKFEILTNVPDEWIVELSAGLNTSVQVQPISLANLDKKFEWIKDVLKDEPYYKHIAWREGESGEFDARDIVAFLTCFNIALFPNAGNDHPVVAYEKKSAALKMFEEDAEDANTYRKLAPILKDILVLHDTIRFESSGKWNKEGGGKFGALSLVEGKKRGEHIFFFINKKNRFRLMNGALYPILASFRWMVEEGHDGTYCWRGGFQSVLRIWSDTAIELMKTTVQQNQDLGRNPNAVGKSRGHWANLHRLLAVRDLMSQRSESGA